MFTSLLFTVVSTFGFADNPAFDLPKAVSFSKYEQKIVRIDKAGEKATVDTTACTEKLLAAKTFDKNCTVANSFDVKKYDVAFAFEKNAKNCKNCVSAKSGAYNGFNKVA